MFFSYICHAVKPSEYSAQKLGMMIHKQRNHRAAAGCHSDNFVWFKIKENVCQVELVSQNVDDSFLWAVLNDKPVQLWCCKSLRDKESWNILSMMKWNLNLH